MDCKSCGKAMPKGYEHEMCPSCIRVDRSVCEICGAELLLKRQVESGVCCRGCEKERDRLNEKGCDILCGMMSL